MWSAAPCATACWAWPCGTGITWWWARRRRTWRASASSRWARISRYSCTPKPVRNTPWPARSGKPPGATRGSQVHAAPDVSLEEDLRRRDLTINAMAETEDGEIIDPHGGRADLEARLLRHVSTAFAEDPVRILRVARFAARFPEFSVAPETLGADARSMVANGEVDALVPERVWQEMARGLMERQPSRMFLVLRECGALARLLPELDRLFGVPQNPSSHPEIDTGDPHHARHRSGRRCRAAAARSLCRAAARSGQGRHAGRKLAQSRHGHEGPGSPWSTGQPACGRPRNAPVWPQIVAALAWSGPSTLTHGRWNCGMLELLERPTPSAVRNASNVPAACAADFRGRPGHENRPSPGDRLRRPCWRPRRGCRRHRPGARGQRIFPAPSAPPAWRPWQGSAWTP
jgi:tRNA nucleotidyltransferase (CCA-adding enzyme)